MSVDSDKLLTVCGVKCLVVFLELITAIMLHVDHVFLYLSRTGDHDDRDFHSFRAHSQHVAMQQSPDQAWTRRSDLPRDDHRSSSFEHCPRPSSPWPSRPRRSPPHQRSPLLPERQPSLLSVSRISDPFGADRDHRSTFADRRHSLDSFHSGDRSAADVVPRHPQLTQYADSRYQPNHLPETGRPYQNYVKMPHDDRAGASNMNQQRRITKLAQDKGHQGKWSGVQHGAKNDRQQKKNHSGLSNRNTSSQMKMNDTFLASRKDNLETKVRYVPSKAADTGQATKASDQLPADTSVSGESTVPIRPEDIIIIRRYNLDVSAAEKKPEESGQLAKRHVVRLVRNNVVLPLATSGSAVHGSTNAAHTESGVDARQQTVVKKRSWSGVVKTTHIAKTDEGNAGTSTVDNTQPDYTKRLVDTSVDIAVALYN